MHLLELVMLTFGWKKGLPAKNLSVVLFNIFYDLTFCWCKFLLGIK